MASALTAPIARSTPRRTAALLCTCAHLRPRRRFASSDALAPSPTPSTSREVAGPSTATRVPASPQLRKLLQAGERSVPIPLDPKAVVPGTMEPVEGAVADADGRVLHRPIPPELPYPKQQTRRRYLVFLGVTVASWAVFLHYSSNRLRYNTSGTCRVYADDMLVATQSRLLAIDDARHVRADTAPVVQTLIWNVKTSPKVRDALGTDVHIVPRLLGPRVDGTVR